MSMQCIEAPEAIKDKYEPCALMGAATTIAGIRDTATVLHAPGGCNTAAVHLRAGQVHDAFYVPVVSTGLQPLDYISGGKSILIRTIRDVAQGAMAQVKKPKVIWVVTGCATSIIGDDIIGAARMVEEETGIKVIALDTPGFVGGASTGAERVFTAILDHFVQKSSGPQKGLTVVGPHLMGSKNWPNDIKEVRRLLEAADIEVKCVLTHNTSLSDLQGIGESQACLMLTSEDMPNLQDKTKNFNLSLWGQDVVLPLGVANTEEWFLKVAEDFGNVEKAKQTMRQDMDRVKAILKGNYNASWILNFLFGKYASVIAPAPFAAALARYLYYDLNVKPKVVALLSSTQIAIDRAKAVLKELAHEIDIEVMENPTYYRYGLEIQKAGVDFSIGMRQDRVLTEGLDIPHASLAGTYFFNQFNFVPYPYMGILGSLNLLSEMARLVEDAFSEKEAWKVRAYKPRHEE